MPTFLAPLATRMVLMLLALVTLLGVFAYIWYLRDQVASAHRQLAQSRGTITALVADNRADMAALNQLRAQSARWRASLATAQSQDAMDRGQANAIRRTISAAPVSANGPVAPVLAATLRAIARAQHQRMTP